MANTETNLAKRIAMNGMLTALAWIMIILSTYLPTGRFFILAISSLCVVISWLEWGKKAAFTVYLTVAILDLLWPGVIKSLSFLTFFGLFPLLFLMLQSKLPRIPASLLLHLIMTILLVAVIWIVGIDRLVIDTKGLDGLALWAAIIVLLQIIFVVFSYLLGRLTQLWLDRIKKRS
ncbi:MAG: hypothetical protein GX832_00235 [Clostridiales bacterium]|nr:hypothetical protein [Clostridiales bacterium]